MFRRRLYALFSISGLMLLLSGCSSAVQKTVSTEDLAKGTFWEKYFVYPLSYSLDWLAAHLWGQYGLSILILTIIIRFAILPLTLKQYRSSKQMQAIQPDLKKIKDKYKDDPKKQQEETMKLFQQNGVNPLAGCFPLLIQMPILIALYNAIIKNPAIREHSFLWMQLGTKDPYYILPLIAALTTLIQQKVMSSQTQMPNQMQGLMYIFPVLIFVMAMNFASALPLYWIYSNTFTIVQTYFIYGGSQQQKGGLSK